MRKTIDNTILFLTILCAFLIILNSTDIVYSVRFSIDIWLDDIFPSLFPFFIISYILLDLSFTTITNNFLGNFIYKLFKIKKDASFVLIMSILSGFPSSAKYTKELYERNIINDKEATKLLTFTHFSNPIFILYAIGISFIGDKKMGVIILISQYLANLLIGILFRDYYVSTNNKIKPLKTPRKPIGIILSNAIKNAIDTLFLILGSITIFLIITTLINKYVNLPVPFNIIINGFFEMTQGVKSLKYAFISKEIKTILAAAFISFGGLSVHLQVLSIISNTKIKYYPYLISRIIHTFLAVVIVCILLKFLG